MMMTKVAQRRADQSRRTGSWGEWPVGQPKSDRFIWQLDALLRRLGDVHLRISLAQLSSQARNGDEMMLGQAIADNLLDPCAMAGVMPDGSVVAAFLGPRADAGLAGDDEIGRRIRRRFQQAIGMVANQNDFTPSRLAIVHGWTDELCDLSTMTHELTAAPPAMVNHVPAV